MKKIISVTLGICVIMIGIFSCLPTTKASMNGKITGTGVTFRKTPGTNGEKINYLYKGNIVTLNSQEKVKGTGCDDGWYSVNYNGYSGYVCSTFVSLTTEEERPSYNRPWTSPKKAILGGAEFISSGYIEAGQNTSYLKKFNVNPNGEYKVNTHQYMANLAAPFSEAKKSYESYKENNLLSLPLHFTIPIFNNMPESSPHPVYGEEKGGTSKVTDKTFEKKLDAEKFPESYKKWLRSLHEKYPNWTFESLETGLDFNTTVAKQQPIGSIQKSVCKKCVDSSNFETEPGWYLATKETVAYFLDPRNFLEDNSILMFEDLSFNDVYKEETVKSVLKGTFMEGKDNVDNLTYSSMFMEAGKTFNVNPVYLASLSRQEMGTTKGIASSGEKIEYKGVTYIGFYNFYNIGAYSSEENPAKAGVVYAALGGERNSEGIYVGNIKGTSTPVSKPSTDNNTSNNNTNNTTTNKPTNPSNNQNTTPTNPTETIVPVSKELKNMKLNQKGNYLTNLTLGISVKDLKAKSSSELTFKKANGGSLGDTEKITTGTKVKFKTGEEFTLVVYGDLTGDGNINGADLLKMRQYLLGQIQLEGAYLEAAHVYTTKGNVNGADLLKIRQHLLGKNSINQS